MVISKYSLHYLICSILFGIGCFSEYDGFVLLNNTHENCTCTISDELPHIVADMKRFYAEKAHSVLSDRPIQPGADDILPVFPPVR